MTAKFKKNDLVEYYREDDNRTVEGIITGSKMKDGEQIYTVKISPEYAINDKFGLDHSLAGLNKWGYEDQFCMILEA